jgi:hypothetical protein
MDPGDDDDTVQYGPRGGAYVMKQGKKVRLRKEEQADHVPDSFRIPHLPPTLRVACLDLEKTKKWSHIETQLARFVGQADILLTLNDSVAQKPNTIGKPIRDANKKVVFRQLATCGQSHFNSRIFMSPRLDSSKPQVTSTKEGQGSCLATVRFAGQFSVAVSAPVLTGDETVTRTLSLDLNQGMVDLWFGAANESPGEAMLGDKSEGYEVQQVSGRNGYLNLVGTKSETTNVIKTQSPGLFNVSLAKSSAPQESTMSSGSFCVVL